MGYPIKDLTGQRFGRLVVVESTDKRSGRSVVWECLCDCGNECSVAGYNLTRNNTRSCGCLHSELLAERTAKGLTGQRFGRLVAVESTDERSSDGNVIWLCRCDCGNECKVVGRSLTRNNTRSCGCLWRETRAAMIGPKAPAWNPGLSDKERKANRNYLEYKEWRTAVYERDNYTCQYCGDSTGGNLNAHHIEDYSNNPDLRTTLSNGITLCKKHHCDFHHQYGRGNNTRKQLEEWINNREINND